MATEPTPQLTGPLDAPQIPGPDPSQHLLTGPTQPPPPSPPATAGDAPPAAGSTGDKDEHGSVEEGKGKDEKRGRIWRIALITAIILAVLFVIGVIPRLRRGPETRRDAKAVGTASASPQVATAAVQAPPATDDVTLPGNIQAVQQTAIVARGSGYLSHYYADIGDHVRAGQLLATISSPDLDQTVAQSRAQVSQAQASVAQGAANVGQQAANLSQARANLSRAGATEQQAHTDLSRARAAESQAEEQSAQQSAQLTQAQANLNLARVTATRYRNLLADGAIDQQTTDQAVAALEADSANVRALGAAGRAGQANTRAFRAGVLSAQANVKALADAVQAARGAVGAAQANVGSAQAAVRAAQAAVRAAQANVARNQALQGFDRVTAPFDGVITARSVDTGALISTSGGPAGGNGDSSSVGGGAAGLSAAGNAASGSAIGGSSPGGASSGRSAGGGASLFSLAQTGTLRIFINVPQTYIGVVGVGQTADVAVREMPGRKLKGRVTRTAGALDAASRTLVAEVRLDNRDGALKPGMFAEVHLHVSHPGSAVLIPGSALLTDSAGARVVVINPDHTLHFQQITVGRDFGKTIEVTQGLRASQQIAASPSDSLHEGQKVGVQPAPPPASKPGG